MLEKIFFLFLILGLIRETMIATLKKFRKNEQILVAALQIFILEPAFNYYWFSLVKKRLEQSENMEGKIYFVVIELQQLRFVQFNNMNFDFF